MYLSYITKAVEIVNYNKGEITLQATDEKLRLYSKIPAEKIKIPDSTISIKPEETHFQVLYNGRRIASLHCLV